MSHCQGYISVADPAEGSRLLPPPPPPLFLDQTEARRAEKKTETGLPFYLGVRMTAPPLSEGLDPTLHIAPKTSSILATGG